MKKFAFLFLCVVTVCLSCKSDDSPTCTTCSSELTPPFELCKESNGNASVNGENTGVEYAIYLDGLVSEGVSCN
jgi:hypothetical protein